MKLVLAREIQNGRLSKNLIYIIRALSTVTGNPDNEYKRQKRPRSSPVDIGVVFRKTLGHYTVHTNGREIDCVLSSLLHKQLIYPTADPTSLRTQCTGSARDRPCGSGCNRRPRPLCGCRRWTRHDYRDPARSSKLSRPAPVPGQRVFEQVIVSNADLIVPVFSVANPTPKWGLLDRYLVSAEAAGLPVSDRDHQTRPGMEESPA